METGWFTCDVAVIIRDTLDTGDNANLLRTGVLTLDPIGEDPTGATVRIRHRQVYHVDAATGLLLNPETSSTGPHEAGVGEYRVTLQAAGHTLHWDVALTKSHTKAAPLNLALAREAVPAPGVQVNALPLPVPPSTGTWTLVWGPDGAEWKAGAPTSVKLTVAQGTTTTGSGTATIDSNGVLQLGLTLPATGPHTHPWTAVTDKPTTFPPAAHTHTVADVTGLQGMLRALARSGQNLVLNGGFEQVGANGNPVEWPAPSSTVAYPTGDSRSGARAARLTPTTGNAFSMSAAVPMSAGRSYYIEWWAKKTGTQTIDLGVGSVVRVLRSDGSAAVFIATRMSTNAFPEGVWTKYSVTYTVPASETNVVSGHFAPWVAGPSTNVWLADDVMAVDVTEAVAAGIM